MRKSVCICLLALLTLGLSGCGAAGTGATGAVAASGSSSFGGGDSSAQSSAVSLSLTDAPPAGVAVLSFEVTLNSAVLNPGNVDLLAGQGPIRLEITRLAAEIAALNTASAAAGTYTTLTLTFADPELTFKNNTGASLPQFGCAIGDVCELNSSSLPGPLVSTITFAAPGLVVAGNTPFGLLVDLHLNTLLTGQNNLPGVDFGQTGAATAQKINLPSLPTGAAVKVDDLRGIVLSKDAANNRFTLETAFRGRITVMVDGATKYRDFDGCVPANFACLQETQAVEVELGLLAGGTLYARVIELEERLIPRADHTLDGIIYEITSSTRFKMVLVDLRRDIGLLRGRRVTVQLQTPVQFEVATHGLTVPSALVTAFQSATDTSQLRVGQHVQVNRLSLSTGPPIVVDTNRVRLQRSPVNATVSTTPAPSGANFLFDVNGLSGLFTGAGITLMHTQTTPETDFEGVTSASELAIGRQVSMRGLIFADASPTALQLIADKVRARP